MASDRNLLKFSEPGPKTTPSFGENLFFGLHFNSATTETHLLSLLTLWPDIVSEFTHLFNLGRKH